MSSIQQTPIVIRAGLARIVITAAVVVFAAYLNFQSGALDWKAILFFGLITLWIASLIRNEVRLDEAGITVQGMFRRQYYAWADVEAIFVVTMQGAGSASMPHVGLKLAPTFRGPRTARAKVFHPLCDVAFSTSAWGKSPGQWVDVMQELRRKFRGEGL